MSPPSYKDPWALLEIDRSADDSVIKRAYRQQAKRYHPDRNPGDAEAETMFQEVARAYEEIHSEEARERWLAANESLSVGLDFPPFPSADQAPRRKMSHEIAIDFAKAFTGTQMEVSVEVEDVCPTCGGSGAAPGFHPRRCELCGGSGEHAVGRLKSRCSGCHGRGFTVERACPACQGGLLKEPRPYVLRIPAGVFDGYQMRIDGPQRGRFGSTDLEITIKVEPSAIFKRELADVADLMIDVPITYSEAALGASVRVPTPAKVIKLTIPAGTTSNKLFKVSGEGMPRLNGPEGARGDLFAKIRIEVPKQMSKEQRRLIEELSALDSADLRQELFTG